MPKLTVPAAGAAGVVKDVTQDKLPLGAWTDANNMRFLDGSAQQFFGYGQVYGAASAAPLHVLQLNIGQSVHWLYAGAQQVYDVTLVAGAPVHTNLTRRANGADLPYNGAPNQWTSTTLSGVPILNNGVDTPQQWNLDPASRMQQLDNWPSNTRCKSMRAYKNFLLALGVSRNGVELPFNVMWSSPADPGGVPTSWANNDPTSESGDYDLAEGGDYIVDGLQLRDSFMIYKQQSVWRMDLIGGPYVFTFRKVLGVSGALNRNCIVEIDGFHVVLTASDVVVHDGQSATSVLDKVARRTLFQDMDTAYTDRAFVFKNPYFNEVYVCYVSIGGTAPDKAMVWNYVDKTVTYRSIPNLNHASFGAVENSLGDAWSSDSASWESDLTPWNGPDFTPGTARVLAASADSKLLLLDASASADGQFAQAYLERRGLGFGEDERMKRVVNVRPRIKGSPGETVIVRVGGHMTDPEADPEYDVAVEFVIGEDVVIDCIVEYRYIAIRFETGTATQWRLTSFDYDIQLGGKW